MIAQRLYEPRIHSAPQLLAYKHSADNLRLVRARERKGADELGQEQVANIAFTGAYRSRQHCGSSRNSERGA
jgi:hypothetical protein